MKICISKYIRWKYLLLPIIIYVSDDTVLFGTNINQTFIYAKYAILVSVLLMLSFGNKGFVHTRQFRFCIGMCLLVMFSSLLNDDLRLGLVYKCVVLLLSCAYVSKVRFEKFSQYLLYSYMCHPHSFRHPYKPPAHKLPSSHMLLHQVPYNMESESASKPYVLYHSSSHQN